MTSLRRRQRKIALMKRLSWAAKESARLYLALPRTYVYAKRFISSDIVFSRILTNSGWLLGANALTKMLALFQSIIVARMLGAEQYGILAVVTTYATMVNEFVDSRVWEAAIKFVIQYRENGNFGKATATVKLCYLVDSVTGVAAFTVVLLSSTFAAQVFVKDGSKAGLIQIYAVSMLLAIPLGTSTSILRITDHFSWLAYESAAMVLLRLIGVLIVAATGQGLKGILFVYLITIMAGSLVLVACSRRAARELNLTTWRQAPLSLLRDDYREIFRFMIYSNLSGTTRIVTSRADVLILGWLSVPASVGIYKLAKAVADALSSLFHPIYLAVYPEFSKLAGQGDLLQMRSLRRKLSGAIAAVILPLCLSFTLGAAWLIPRFFGKEFIDAVTPMQILIWQIVWTPLIWLPGYLLSVGRAQLLAGLNVLDAANYVALLFLLTPVFGVVGTAMATLLRLVLWALLAGWILIHLSHAERPQEKIA